MPTPTEPTVAWKKKLHPRRFPQISGKMSAIIGYVCEETYTDPAISELVVTSDGFVLSQNEGECGANTIIGNESSLRQNWTGLLDAAGLTAQERETAQAAFDRRVISFRVTVEN